MLPDVFKNKYYGYSQVEYPQQRNYPQGRYSSTGPTDTFNSPLVAKYKAEGKLLSVRPWSLQKIHHWRPVGTIQVWDQTEYVDKTTTYRYAAGTHLLRTDPTGAEYGALDKAYNIATRKFYNKLDELDIDLAVTLGEAPKTFEFIARTAGNVARSLKSLKRLDVSEALKALGMPTGGRHARQLHRESNSARKSGLRESGDFMADKWLELKYGWKPLLQDVENLADALQKQGIDQPQHIKITASGRTTFDEPFTAVQPGAYLSGSSSANARAAVHLGAYFSVFDADLRVRSQLGLTSLGSVAWELIPWSFVVDWFVPVGDYVAAHSALAGLQFSQGYVSKTTQIQAQAHVNEIGSSPCNLEENITVYRFKREVLTGPPSMLRILNAKDFNSLLNLDKLATSLALLQSIRR